MMLHEAVESTSKRLADAGIQNPRLESEFLLASLLKVPRAHLFLRKQFSIPDDALRDLESWAMARQSRKPLAYIAGEQPFRDLILEVTADVLIPRPETELVVEQALKVLDTAPAGSTVVDVGTGAGNIAISLAAHPRVQRCVGIDLSEAALQVARRNAERCGVSDQCLWFHGDLLEPLQDRFLETAMVVANLPYVRTAELATLEPEIAWEPRIALDGGEDGLALITRCVQQASNVLPGGGWLILEIGYDQGRAVSSMLACTGVWEQIQVLSDMSGIPRIAQARRKGF